MAKQDKWQGSKPGSGLKRVNLTLPAKSEDIAALEIGSIVFLSGVVYTARERVYEKVMKEGHSLPAGLTDISNVNFHCSPAAAIDDDGSFRIGGVTATASFRFSKYMAEWLDLTGTKIVIGKGGMPREDYEKVLAPRGVIYLTTVGYGTGALLGTRREGGSRSPLARRTRIGASPLDV